MEVLVPEETEAGDDRIGDGSAEGQRTVDLPTGLVLKFPEDNMMSMWRMCIQGHHPLGSYTRCPNIPYTHPQVTTYPEMMTMVVMRRNIMISTASTMRVTVGLLRIPWTLMVATLPRRDLVIIGLGLERQGDAHLLEPAVPGGPPCLLVHTARERPNPRLGGRLGPGQ